MTVYVFGSASRQSPRGVAAICEHDLFMTPWWMPVGIILAIGALMFIVPAGLIYLGHRVGGGSPATQQRLKIASFLIAVLMVSWTCVELLISSDADGLGVALLPMLLLGCVDRTSRTLVSSKPPMLILSCIGFTVLMLASSLAPQPISHPLQRVVHHPGFVIPVWLFLVWQLVRLWQKEKVKAQA